MSKASERKAMVRAIKGYSLMGVPECAALLDCTEDVARAIELPSVMVGKRRKFDPVDVAVYVLAGKEGIEAAEYWTRYSESDVLENVRRFYRRAKNVAAA